MTNSIIIAFCVLVLLAYLFDVSSAKSKIPSVVLLLLLGYVSQFVVHEMGINLPDLKPLLPIFGTVGLILIVLEGGLDLELNKSKIGILSKASKSAAVPMVLLLITLTLGFHFFGHLSVMTSIVNSIPVCVISSAIAIPSVKNLSERDKSFVVYESSLSDIFGVILFNFFTVNEVITWLSIGEFFLQTVITIALSLVASFGLAFLISRVKHHVKFLPIVVTIILIYTIAKVYHLPALIFILAFGLALNNVDEFKHLKWMRFLKPEVLEKETQKFKEITIEGAFLVRTIFFLLFGFTVDGLQLIDLRSLQVALLIVSSIFVIRFLYLKWMGVNTVSIYFVFPRGLITILLFLSIPSVHAVNWITEGLMTQIILITTFIMMVGLLFHKKTT